jgi:hypothetical protein
LRLRHLMCGSGYALPRNLALFFPGYARKHQGHSPKKKTLFPIGPETYRTSGGIAAKQYLTGALARVNNSRHIPYTHLLTDLIYFVD